MNRLKSKKLAINGGTPAFKGQWSDGVFHFPEEIEAMKKVLSGPRLSLALGE